MSNTFWRAADDLLAASHIVVERPKGSRHPRFEDIEYPLDYGFIAGTSGGDGAEIDVWLGTMPGEYRIVGALMTIDRNKRDAEVKFLVNCTDEEVATALQFHEGNNMGVVLVRRSDE